LCLQDVLQIIAEHQPAPLTVNNMIVHRGNGVVVNPGRQSVTIGNVISGEERNHERESDDEHEESDDEHEECDDEHEESDNYMGEPMGESGQEVGAFAKSFLCLTKEKWVLRSGTVVEDVMYKAVQNTGGRQSDILAYLHNWIINVDSQEMQALFKLEDWHEICAAVKVIPQTPDPVARALSTQFANVCTFFVQILIASNAD
jgi:hypothetical protein